MLASCVGLCGHLPPKCFGLTRKARSHCPGGRRPWGRTPRGPGGQPMARWGWWAGSWSPGGGPGRQQHAGSGRPGPALVEWTVRAGGGLGCCVDAGRGRDLGRRVDRAPERPCHLAAQAVSTMPVSWSVCSLEHATGQEAGAIWRDAGASAGAPQLKGLVTLGRKRARSCSGGRRLGS